MLYVVGAYLFANGGQTVSLRWLALFCDFEQAQKVNWGHACLACLYLVMDTLSWGLWKFLEVRLFSFSHVVLPIVLYTLANCICFIFLRCHLGLQIAFHTFANSVLLSCKLYLCPFFLANCIYVLFCANYHLAHYICAFFLVALGTDVNLKVFLSVWAHLNGLTSDSVSKIPFSQYHCMLQRFLSNHKCPCRLFGDLGQVFLWLMTRSRGSCHYLF